MKSARGVCIGCGAYKDRAMGSCPACGQRPEGEDRLRAWLLSRHHLDEDELVAAAEQVAQGKDLQPSADMLRRARRALFPAQAEAQDREQRARGSGFQERDRPLTAEEKVLLGVSNVLLSPLIGLVAWGALRGRRPVAARQSLVITLPITVFLGGIWLWVMVESGAFQG